MQRLLASDGSLASMADPLHEEDNWTNKNVPNWCSSEAAAAGSSFQFLTRHGMDGVFGNEFFGMK